MFKRISLAAVLAASITPAFATTAVGSATLVDNATVHSGTVAPTTYLSYVSGGNGAVGFATGSTYGFDPSTPAQAMATADHIWLQYDPAILMTSGNTFLSQVLAIPALGVVNSHPALLPRQQECLRRLASLPVPGNVRRPG